jgi:hypothetical protein
MREREGEGESEREGEGGRGREGRDMTSGYPSMIKAVLVKLSH